MLADESGLKEKDVRVGLSYLEKTGDITQTLYGNVMVITLTDYEMLCQD